jgi:hypothetical protein
MVAFALTGTGLVGSRLLKGKRTPAFAGNRQLLLERIVAVTERVDAPMASLSPAKNVNRLNAIMCQIFSLIIRTS